MRWLPVGESPKPGQELELHVGELSGLAQLLLDRMSKQPDHLDQGEVGTELDGVQGPAPGSGMPEPCNLLRIRSGATVRSTCFQFEAHPTQTTGAPLKAVRFHEHGDPDVLRYEDVEQPVPGAGEVRLRVAATSFNPVDGGIRGGYLQGPFPVALPHTPGIDVAGIVDALGDGVQSVAVGDAVVAFLPMTADGAAADTSSHRPTSWRRRRRASRSRTPRRSRWSASPPGRRSSTTRSSRPGSAC